MTLFMEIGTYRIKNNITKTRPIAGHLMPCLDTPVLSLVEWYGRLHRLGRDPCSKGTEGANRAISCRDAVKLSGKRTRAGRTSGESVDTEGANPERDESLRLKTEGAHIFLCAPFLHPVIQF